MATIDNSLLKNVLENVAKQMTATLAEIRATYTQAGDKGYNAEELLREFLRRYISRKLAVAHGEIVDRVGNRSGQTDVVVVNDDHPFTFTTNKPGLFFIEGVVATGEVKSTLNSTHMRLAIEAAQKLKVFRPTFSKGSMIHTNVSDTERFYSCPPHFVFAFESELTLPTIAASITAKDPDLNERPYGSIDAVFVLGKGWAINFGDGTGGYKYADANGISRPGWQWAATDAVLFHCLAWLSAVMPVVLRFEPIILGYMVPQKP